MKRPNAAFKHPGLRSYPTGAAAREIRVGQRSFGDRIVASMRGVDFFDGARNRGYGGLRYDGRWNLVAKDFVEDFELNENSRVLQLQCEKGFLLHEFRSVVPGIEVRGTEESDYALGHLHEGLADCVIKCRPMELGFPSKSFDLVIALGVVYTLTIRDAIDTLREISRVARGNAFVTLASYSSEDEHQAMREWSLLGNLILRETEWQQIMEWSGYTGAYDFVTATTLGVRLMY